MKVSYNWLKEYVSNLPKPEKLAELLTMHSFEVESVEKIRNDHVLDIDVLPNRAHDCLSHIGVTRECAALLKSKVQSPKSKVTEDKKLKVDDFVGVEVKNKELCPRYTARVITDIKVGPSPQWMQERLKAVGQKPINNIVDATNYIALEMGQPLHAFDAEKLDGKKIIIRRARKGEKITTLEDEKCDLDGDILVIADSKDPIAIAGIKGGKKAEIDKNTKTIILESANFNLNNIHASSRKLGISTESSLRFEHGLDPNLASKAIDRLAEIIQKNSGGKITRGMADIYPDKIKPCKISLKVDKVNSVLGVEISEKEIIRILSSLGFNVKRSPTGEKIVKLAEKFIGKPYKLGASAFRHAPEAFNCSSLVRYVFWQMNIDLPCDSIEQIELGKRINKKDLEPGDLVFSKGTLEPRRNKKWPQGVGHVGIYIGEGKVIHAVFEGKKVVKTGLEKFIDWRGACRVLDEPLIVEVPTRRLDIEIPEDLIEEIGRIYGYEKISSKLPLGILVSAKPDDLLRLKNKVKDILDGLGMTEVYNYSFIGDDDLEKLKLSSEDYIELENPLSLDLKYLRRDLITNLLKNIRENFKYFSEVQLFEIGRVYLNKEKTMLAGAMGRKEDKKELFYEAKGMVDGFLNKLGITNQWYSDFRAILEKTNKIFWYSGRSAQIKLNGQMLGFVGEINPETLSRFGIKGQVAAFNLDFELLIKLISEELVYQHPSKYPAIVRDIAVLVNLGDRVADVLNVINSTGGDLIQDVDLFDMYEGGEIPRDKKNLAFHIVYQTDDRTLTDKEVDKIHNKIIGEISKRRGWDVRK